MAFQFILQSITEFCLTGLAGLNLGGPRGEPPEFDIPLGTFSPWLVVLLPMAGGLLAGILVFWLAPEAEGHGTDAAIDAYHRKMGRIRYRVPLVKMFASAITMGMGGSGGREGPIAQIGAGFGVFLADRLHLSARDRRILLAAGIGAGVGSIFRAPLAGALFAGEVLYSSQDLETEVLLPATVSSIVAYSVYATRFGWGHMFGDSAGLYGFSNPVELLPYLALAVILAGGALLYTRCFYGTSALFKRLPMPRWTKPVLGGAITGGIGLALILGFGQIRDAGDVLAGGYGVIQHIIDSDGMGVPLGILAVVCLGKILTTSSSIGSGGSGGVFGPSMVIGATLGGVVGRLFHMAMPSVVQHPSTFAIVGMAGFFAAAAKTPISTVVMVSELTGNYQLLVPSMWVCTIAFLISQRWTIYRSQVPSRAWSPVHFGEFAPEVLSSATVGEVFDRTRKCVKVPAGAVLTEILRLTDNSRQRLFPVVDQEERLLGTFRIDQLTHAVRGEEREQKRLRARDLVCEAPAALMPGDSVDRAQRMLRSRGIEEMLVLDPDRPGHVLGILTGADILLAYTRRLSEDRLQGAT
jgi:CIC family chloride channel protein